MICDLKPYPVMKDSGVPWLGEVPGHWEVAPPKRALQSRSAGAVPVKNTASLEPRSGYVPAFSASGQDVWLPTPMFNGPALVLSAVGARCGKTFRAYGKWAIVANTHALMVRRNQLRDYWWYVTNDEAWWERAGAAQPFVQVSKTLDRPWAIPPLAEQAAIVRYLDYMDRRIRKYIRTKQKLIKLLEEQKQAIIHRAVTCGLDPNVRLKPSGVEWLGDIPEHWEVVALRFRYSQCLGKMLDAKRVLGVHSLPYLRNTDVQWDRINTTDLPVMDIAPSEYDRYTVRSGDLLVCEGGEVGRCAIWNGGLEPCGFQKALHRLRPLSLERDLPRFLYYVFRVATKSGAFEDGHESTIAHLTGDKLRAHRLPFPGEKEQVEIVVYLDAASAAFARTMAEAHREISLLREYRTRLFADVVTGKLDVHEAAARLPDETDEPEPIDYAESPVDN
ncbi:MAG: restriction endonuclease subunit S, partial [Acidobacteria bacterium]|nr:restriction endonuclease subunit S [Acidobacteriota bacterium]